MGRVLLTAREHELAWLDLKVAEALGGVWCQHPLDAEGRAVAAGEPYLCEPDWPSFKERPKILRPANAIEFFDGPEYSSDWSVTGPLIEKYSIDIARTWKTIEADVPGDHWLARIRAGKRGLGEGPTPLIAVCSLLVTLAAAGQLKISP